MYKLYKENCFLEDSYHIDDLELILDNKFRFTRKYDMEYCGYLVENNPINWEYIPFNDPEWRWVFHRMDYCYDLCVQSIKTNDLKYANKAKELIFNFIKQNKHNERTKTLRTLDTGIRLTVWVDCVSFFKKLNILTNEEYLVIKKSVSWQIDHLYKDYQPYHDFSNWGFMQAIGVLNCSYEFNINNVVTKFYEGKYYNHLNTQFNSDGLQWEQSSVYTVEVTVRMLQLENPKYKNFKYFEVLKQSAHAIYALGNIDGKTIALGDGDEIDIYGLIQQIAFVCKDKKFLELSGDKKIREEVYFRFGDQVLSFFSNRTQCKKDKIFEYDLKQSGIRVLKSNDRYLSFQNSPLGGGHGHFDNLHVNYSLDSQKILIDSGRFTYVDGKKRNEFKGESAHNGIQLEDKTYEYISSWDCKASINYTPIVKIKEDEIIYLESSVHTKYKSGFRKLILLPSGELVVIDFSFSKFDVNFIIDPNQIIKVESDDTLKIGNNKLTAFNSHFEIERCMVSNKYNKERESSKVSYKNNIGLLVNCFCKKNTSVTSSNNIQIFESDSKDPLTREFVCIEIKSEQSEYYLAICPYETGENNILSIEGNLVKGSIVLFDKVKRKSYVFKK